MRRAALLLLLLVACKRGGRRVEAEQDRKPRPPARAPAHATPPPFPASCAKDVPPLAPRSCEDLARGAGEPIECPYEPTAHPPLAAPDDSGIDAGAGVPDFSIAFERGAGCRSGGEVALPSGAILAVDPLVFLDNAPPFVGRVTPGHYPVILRTDAPDDPSTNAFALVRFSDRRPVRWVPALLPGEDGTGGKNYGYPVDTGTGSYVDETSAKRILARERAENLPHEGWLYKVLIDAKLLERDVAHACDGGANLVAFGSGIGDGSYEVWWGLADDGCPAAMVTDFELFDLGRGMHPWIEGMRPQ